MQILHYENGQKYEPHFDYFHDKVNQELGGHRVAIVLMYLSNVEKGRETIFPNSKAIGSQPKGDTWSDCARKGYAGCIPGPVFLVKSKRGDALLFFNLHPDASTDANSLHGSCPVIEGEKWSATKWIHVRSFNSPSRDPKNGECVDMDKNCSKWAAEVQEKSSLHGGISSEHWLLSQELQDLQRVVEGITGEREPILSFFFVGANLYFFFTYRATQSTSPVTSLFFLGFADFLD